MRKKAREGKRLSHDVYEPVWRKRGKRIAVFAAISYARGITPTRRMTKWAVQCLHFAYGARWTKTF